MMQLVYALLTCCLAVAVPALARGQEQQPADRRTAVFKDVVIRFPDPRNNRALYRKDQPETYPYGYEYMIFAEVQQVNSRTPADGGPGGDLTLEGTASDGLLVLPFRPIPAVRSQQGTATLQGCGGYVRDEFRSRERWATLDVGERTYLLEVGTHTQFQPAGLNLGDGFWQLTPGRSYQVVGDILQGKTVAGSRFDSLVRVYGLKLESTDCKSKILINDPYQR
jgi:hypothetical protein